MKERNSIAQKGFREALQEKFGLVLLCMGPLNKCHLRAGAMGNSEATRVHIKLLALKGYFESDTWTH